MYVFSVPWKWRCYSYPPSWSCRSWVAGWRSWRQSQTELCDLPRVLPSSPSEPPSAPAALSHKTLGWGERERDREREIIPPTIKLPAKNIAHWHSTKIAKSLFFVSTRDESCPYILKGHGHFQAKIMHICTTLHWCTCELTRVWRWCNGEGIPWAPPSPLPTGPPILWRLHL